MQNTESASALLSSEAPWRPPRAAADPAMDSKVTLCGLCCVQLTGGDQEVRRHMETVHSRGARRRAAEDEDRRKRAKKVLLLCQWCKEGESNSTFEDLQKLREHIIKEHLGKEMDEKAEEDEASLAQMPKQPKKHPKKTCHVCSKLFSDSKSLKKHLQGVHARLKPYICHVCNHQVWNLSKV